MKIMPQTASNTIISVPDAPQAEAIPRLATPPQAEAGPQPLAFVFSLRQLLALWLAMLLCYVIYFFMMFQSNLQQIPTLMDQLWPDFYKALGGLLKPNFLSPIREDELFIGIMWQFGLLLLLLSALYGTAIYVAHRLPDTKILAFALITTAVMSIPLWIAPGMLSTDVYLYTSYGQMAQLHNTDPSAVVPEKVIKSPLLDYVYWRDQTSAYGPLWTDVERGVTILVQVVNPDVKTNIPLYVLAYKLIAIGGHLLNIFLIYAILSRWKPERRAFGVILYAWNPLAMLEFANSGHNDMVSLTCVLAGILLYLRGRPYLAVAAMTLGVLFKLTSLFIFIPFGLLLLWQAPRWRRRLITLAASGAIFLALATAFYLPYWHGADTFKPLTDGPSGRRMINSPAQIFYLEWLRLALPDLQRQNPQYNAFYYDKMKRWPVYPEDPINDDVKYISAGLMVVVMTWNLWRVRNFSTFLRHGSWILFYSLIFTALWFWPWYVILPLGIVALRQFDALSLLVVVFSCSSLFLWLVWSNVPPIIIWALDYRAAFMFGPPLIIAVIAYPPRRRVVQRTEPGPSPQLTQQKVPSLCWSTANAAARLILVRLPSTCLNRLKRLRNCLRAWRVTRR